MSISNSIFENLWVVVLNHDTNLIFNSHHGCKRRKRFYVPFWGQLLWILVNFLLEAAFCHFLLPPPTLFLLRFSSSHAHIKASGDRSEHPASGELLFNFSHSFQQLLPAPSSYSGPLLTSCLVESAEVLWGAASLCHLPFTSTIL